MRNICLAALLAAAPLSPAFSQTQDPRTAPAEKMEGPAVPNQPVTPPAAAPASDPRTVTPPISTEASKAALSDKKMRSIKTGELESATVYGQDGQVIGDVDEIVLTKDGKQVALVSIGGFLGIGATTVGVPLEDFHYADDRLTWRDLDRAQAEKLPKWADKTASEADDETVLQIETR